MMLRPVLACILCVSSAALACAQKHPVQVSGAEEEKIRDAAAEPALRVSVFQAIIETRIRRIQGILADKRAQGRREDIAQNLQEISGLVDEMQDNLDEYDQAHRDLRKPLPKLLDAIPRWESVLKQLPSDTSYNLTRTLALEAIADVKQDATEMQQQEAAYFKAHPPDKNANPGGVGPVSPQGAEHLH